MRTAISSDGAVPTRPEADRSYAIKRVTIHEIYESTEMAKLLKAIAATGLDTRALRRHRSATLHRHGKRRPEERKPDRAASAPSRSSPRSVPTAARASASSATRVSVK
jgi:hypothetical protein